MKKLVIVEWLDSSLTDGRWEHRDDIHKMKPAKCTSVGFILDDAKTYITLVGTMSKHAVLGRLTIPRVAIVSMRKLRKASQ
jgi:hypothetical protein